MKQPILKLNCDLGESYGSWTMGMDSAVMPHIHMANIACGFHAGDPDVMAKTLTLARQHNTEIGAHPSYPDIQGFGRRSMSCSTEEIINMVLYQVSALNGMAATKGLSVAYVKPHGAMYNDMMKSKGVRIALYQAIERLNHNQDKPVKLMLLATNDRTAHITEAQEYGIELLFESFADRRYTDEGRLQPRSETGSVLNKAEMMTQVRQLLRGEVTTATGKRLAIQSDTICVHGDNDSGIELIAEIRALCDPEYA